MRRVIDIIRVFFVLQTSAIAVFSLITFFFLLSPAKSQSILGSHLYKINPGTGNIAFFSAEGGKLEVYRWRKTVIIKNDTGIPGIAHLQDYEIIGGSAMYISVSDQLGQCIYTRRLLRREMNV
jgi:hypothetical protein